MCETYAVGSGLLFRGCYRALDLKNDSCGLRTERSPRVEAVATGARPSWDEVCCEQTKMGLCALSRALGQVAEALGCGRALEAEDTSTLRARRWIFCLPP